MIFIKFIPPIIVASQKDIVTTNNRIDSLGSINKAILQKNDSLIQTINRLNEQIDYKQSLLEDFDRLSTNYSIFIGALIGLFALFGVLSYLIGYRPLEKAKEEAHKLLDDVKNNMDKLFSDFTLKNRDKLIDNALSQIETNNTSQKSNAINCLDTYKHDGFNEKQIMRMILLVKKDIRPDFFMPLLSFTESVFSTDFFHEYLKKNPKNGHSTWSCIYAATYDKDEFLNDIAEYIIQTKNLTGVLASIHSSSQSYLEKVYNNDKLVQNIDSETLINHMSYHDKHNEDETSSEKSDRQNSKLYKKYLEVKPSES